jgi:peptidoglycan/xylan/chitin deacetylase (PgdA/CDA1 family)
MNRRVTIVMYHFVRDLPRTRYPRLKSLSTSEFGCQLDYVARNYQVVGSEDVIAAARGGCSLPNNALLLTFDDGYADHFDVVLPLLHDRGWTGCFFPPAAAIIEGRVLEVNKIHFALAAAGDAKPLVEVIVEAIDREGPARGLPSSKQYWHAVAQPSRFDSAEVIFVKRMLQRELPLELRRSITDELFRRFVTEDESAFAAELYMSLDQLRMMQRLGMCVGSHGYDHVWMNTLSVDQQRIEIERGLELLARVGVPRDGWVMCYPYGAWNQALLDLLPSYGCALGLGVEVAVADLDCDHALVLPRFDTNDLPKSSSTADAGPLRPA